MYIVRQQILVYDWLVHIWIVRSWDIWIFWLNKVLVTQWFCRQVCMQNDVQTIFPFYYFSWAQEQMYCVVLLDQIRLPVWPLGLNISKRTTEPTIRLVRSAKTQISLRISAVCAESSLMACAFYSLQTNQRGINENSCHTGWMHSLIWVFFW